jgi:hypothetical protein
MVLAVEPAEECIMDMPPGPTNECLVGLFLFFRIIVGTYIRTFFVVARVF